MDDHAFEVEAVPSDLGVPSAPDVEFGLADDELGLLSSTSFAHARHCFQFAPNSPFAASSVGACPSVSMPGGQNNAIERPRPAHVVRKTAALIDAANLPLAAEHAVVDAVLVDAVAKAGRAHGERHWLMPAAA